MTTITSSTGSSSSRSRNAQSAPPGRLRPSIAVTVKSVGRPPRPAAPDDEAEAGEWSGSIGAGSGVFSCGVSRASSQGDDRAAVGAQAGRASLPNGIVEAVLARPTMGVHVPTTVSDWEAAVRSKVAAEEAGGTEGASPRPATLTALPVRRFLHIDSRKPPTAPFPIDLLQQPMQLPAEAALKATPLSTAVVNSPRDATNRPALTTWGSQSASLASPRGARSPGFVRAPPHAHLSSRYGLMRLPDGKGGMAAAAPASAPAAALAATPSPPRPPPADSGVATLDPPVSSNRSRSARVHRKAPLSHSLSRRGPDTPHHSPLHPTSTSPHPSTGPAPVTAVAKARALCSSLQTPRFANVRTHTLNSGSANCAKDAATPSPEGAAAGCGGAGGGGATPRSGGGGGAVVHVSQPTPPEAAQHKRISLVAKLCPR